MKKHLKALMITIDIGFILYWTVTVLKVLPSDLAFKNYDNPIVIAWNWSFFPLDLLISITGLTSVAISRSKPKAGLVLALVSSILVFCAGFMALSYWLFASDFSLVWWLANGLLVAVGGYLSIKFGRDLARKEP